LNGKVRHIMTGIQFLTDEKGRKVAVQIDLRKHGLLWADFYDGLVSERRRKEKRVSPRRGNGRVAVGPPASHKEQVSR
jgi:hypothetical protein